MAKLHKPVMYAQARIKSSIKSRIIADVHRPVAEKKKRYIARISYAFFRLVNMLRIDQASAVEKETQILLALKFGEMKRNGFPLQKLEDVGFSSFSQTNEDGILLYIFS